MNSAVDLSRRGLESEAGKLGYTVVLIFFFFLVFDFVLVFEEPSYTFP